MAWDACLAWDESVVWDSEALNPKPLPKEPWRCGASVAWDACLVWDESRC